MLLVTDTLFIGNFPMVHHLDGIMHKWANPHFGDFEKKSRMYSMKHVQDETNKYKLTQKRNKSVTKWSNPECETRILIKLLLSMTYIFNVFFICGFNKLQNLNKYCLYHLHEFSALIRSI